MKQHPTVTMFPSELFQVVIFVFLLSLASEIVLYLWCYSAPSFRTINASITKQSRKLDNLNSTTFSAAHKSKKAERLEKGMKQEATKELAVLKVKQTTVVSTVNFAPAICAAPSTVFARHSQCSCSR